MSSPPLTRLLFNNDDGGGDDGLILEQQRHHQCRLLRVALLKQRPAPPWLWDVVVDGNKKVDCQRSSDEVGKEVGTKERGGGGWGGMNFHRIFTSLHGQRGEVMRQTV
jgi:hypothetical protein